MGIFDIIKSLSTPNNDDKPDEIIDVIESQINALTEEREQVIASPDLTPESMMGKKRTYHYKDVNIWTIWKYNGSYGTSYQDIGVQRGNTVEPLPPKDSDILARIGDDPEAIALVWRGIELGSMKSNRLRSMVHQWKEANLPVLAVVSQVGGEQKIMFEFAFYGRPRKK